MKKIKTLFVRKFDLNHSINITDTVTTGCEWAINGEGNPTRKRDGTCVRLLNGDISRRYDCKAGRTPPDGFEPADTPDPITGHWPGWVKVDKNEPKGDEKFFTEGYINSFGSIDAIPEDGTYELCGPKINGNPEKLMQHIMIRHGVEVLDGVPRDFEGIKEYLSSHDIEGIVFHRGNGEMTKIKKTDFGFEWNGKQKKR